MRRSSPIKPQVSSVTVALGFSPPTNCIAQLLHACSILEGRGTHGNGFAPLQYGQDLHECGHCANGKGVWLASWRAGERFTSCLPLHEQTAVF